MSLYGALFISIFWLCYGVELLHLDMSDNLAGQWSVSGSAYYASWYCWIGECIELRDPPSSLIWKGIVSNGFSTVSYEHIQLQYIVYPRDFEAEDADSCYVEISVDEGATWHSAGAVYAEDSDIAWNVTYPLDNDVAANQARVWIKFGLSGYSGFFYNDHCFFDEVYVHGSPTPSPTRYPTPQPTLATDAPTSSTVSPTAAPTASPTVRPTFAPVTGPTRKPTPAPTTEPTADTVSPSFAPTTSPTATPTVSPTESPTRREYLRVISVPYEPEYDVLRPINEKQVEDVDSGNHETSTGPPTTNDDEGEGDGSSAVRENWYYFLLAAVALCVLFTCLTVFFIRRRDANANKPQSKSMPSVSLQSVPGSAQKMSMDLDLENTAPVSVTPGLTGHTADEDDDGNGEDEDDADLTVSAPIMSSLAARSTVPTHSPAPSLQLTEHMMHKSLAQSTAALIDMAISTEMRNAALPKTGATAGNGHTYGENASHETGYAGENDEQVAMMDTQEMQVSEDDDDDDDDEDSDDDAHELYGGEDHNEKANQNTTTGGGDDEELLENEHVHVPGRASNAGNQDEDQSDDENESSDDDDAMYKKSSKTTKSEE